jgi:cell division protein FtsB
MTTSLARRDSGAQSPAHGTVVQTVTPGSAVLLRGRRRQWLRRTVVLAGCVMLVNSLFGDRGLAGTIQARRESHRASRALTTLKQENAGLREQARRLQGDPATIEALAREELGLIRPGEILVVVKELK